ncbi:MAG TPA: response regulator [Bacteroidia bacterium]|nr:response regulator [Bacteroidia bacterium]
MKEVNTIFIVDDDATQLTMVADHLSKFKNITIKTFSSGEECIKNLSLKPQVIFLDYNFDKAGDKAKNGIDVLKSIKDADPSIEVVMLSGQDRIEVAVNTMKYGAFDYIVKNESSFHRAENAVKNIIRKIRLEGNVKIYKRLFITFAICFTLMIAIIIYLWANGYIAKNPGWF